MGHGPSDFQGFLFNIEASAFFQRNIQKKWAGAALHSRSPVLRRPSICTRPVLARRQFNTTNSMERGSMPPRAHASGSSGSSTLNGRRQGPARFKTEVRSILTGMARGDLLVRRTYAVGCSRQKRRPTLFPRPQSSPKSHIDNSRILL